MKSFKVFQQKFKVNLKKIHTDIYRLFIIKDFASY